MRDSSFTTQAVVGDSTVAVHIRGDEITVEIGQAHDFSEHPSIIMFHGNVSEYAAEAARREKRLAEARVPYEQYIEIISQPAELGPKTTQNT